MRFGPCGFVPILFLLGCSGNNSPIARAAGSWPADFKFDQGDSSDRLTGNLELYVTGRKFRLDMATAHQQFSVLGKWTAERSRVTMIADNYTFENPTEEDQKALGLKLIAPEQIRAVFGHPFVLDESEDRRRLTGLTTSFGSRVGHFEFVRNIPH